MWFPRNYQSGFALTAEWNRKAAYADQDVNIWSQDVVNAYISSLTATIQQLESRDTSEESTWHSALIQGELHMMKEIALEAWRRMCPVGRNWQPTKIRTMNEFEILL